MIQITLGRPEVRFEERGLRAFFASRSVLITGAAGSIGSALAYKLAGLGCRRLFLLDQFDHGLIEVTEQTARMAPAAQVSDLLCDVRDLERLKTIVARAQPDVVIHAAALKHVHMGERHPGECVLTNLVGVHNILEASAAAGAAHFVLISSDKAAAPSCVMGATKRLAELHLAGFGEERRPAMRLKAVRFGNVLGSQGSVLPRFEAQIEAGGPLGLTHPAMERFFMTPDEAVGLILSVTALEPDDGAYFMEMGAPVSIADIAKEMIRRSGKAIGIAITGLRPGEKLKEQLSDAYESVAAASVPGVFRVRPYAEDAQVSSAEIAELRAMARTRDDAIVRQRVFAFLDQRLQREERAVG